MDMKSGFNGNDNVVKPNIQQSFDDHQMAELAKCAADPIYFIETYCKIVSLDKGIIPFKMYEPFKHYVRTVHNNRFVLLQSGRQMGKCTGKDTNYTVRNKITGEVRNVRAKEFHETVQLRK